MFAVPMAPVQEIIRVPEVARMPLTPAALDGLSNLRGRVLPIINLRRLFNTAERVNDDSSRALVINLGQSLGFVVDRVSSVISIDAGDIEPVRAIQSVVQADYLTGVINRTGPDGQRQLLLVLDFARLVQQHFTQIATRQTSGARHPVDQGGPADTDSEHASDDLRLVSFTVCDQEYAIDIADVQEIVQVPGTITAVPNTPAHVLGLISLRQRLLPLVSLRTLFDLAPAELTEHHRIVVVALPGGGQIGLVTDSAKEVLSVPRSQADAMPGLLARDERLQEFSSICRLDNGRRLVSIIATDKLLGMPAISEALQISRTDPVPHDLTPDTDMNAFANASKQSDDDDAQVVIFRLGAEEFGVPIMSVQEIVRLPDTLTRVPKTPRFVEGVINLRGTVLPVIDQRTRLGMPAIERNDRQRIMVYTLNGLRTGFIVDSVAEVLRIPRQHIAPAPQLSDEQMSLIGRVAKLDGERRLVMLIDPNQLLAAREIHAMNTLADVTAEHSPSHQDAPHRLARAA
ncbi:chemotaxis protein CheW [Sphaerotilus sp.]|uniref:chemotaxis protein CheW n=1 Tax=Sphaerotilus sp. TaxID=2093942 RepID=UPI003A103A88